jgi:hypothetical protein
MIFLLNPHLNPHDYPYIKPYKTMDITIQWKSIFTPTIPWASGFSQELLTKHPLSSERSTAAWPRPTGCVLSSWIVAEFYAKSPAKDAHFLVDYQRLTMNMGIFSETSQRKHLL